MEALSPRTTNQMIKPKPPMDRKMVDKNPPAGAAQKASTSKHHADPPPPIVPEPEDGGERYSIGGFLGKGGFAVCYEGTLARNGRVFAMKVVKSHMPQKKMEEKVCLFLSRIAIGGLLISVSFEPNFKSTLRCATPSLSNSIARSHSSRAPTSSSSYVPMDRSWTWFGSDGISACQRCDDS